MSRTSRRWHGRYPVHSFEIGPDGKVRLQKILLPEKGDDEKRFQVRFRDLDLNRHANNVSYIEWTLETVPEMLWQKSRIAELEIEYLAESVLGDTVVAQAQLPKAAGGEMRHRLFRSGDKRELVRARSLWRGK